MESLNSSPEFELGYIYETLKSIDPKLVNEERYEESASEAEKQALDAQYDGFAKDYQSEIQALQGKAEILAERVFPEFTVYDAKEETILLEPDAFRDVSQEIQKAPSWFEKQWTTGWTVETSNIITTALATAVCAVGKFAIQALGTVTGIMPLIGRVQDRPTMQNVERGYSANIATTYDPDLNVANPDHYRRFQPAEGDSPEDLAQKEENMKAALDAENQRYQEMHRELNNGHGIVDVTGSGRSFGYIMDGSGHGRPENYRKMEKVNQLMQEKLSNLLDNNQFETVEELQQAVQQVILEVDGKMEKEFCVGSTFSMAAVTQVKGKKVALTFHVGDSSLWLVKKDGRVGKLTQSAEDKELGKSQKNQLEMKIFEVEEGDRIVGVTDGITDYLKEDFLKVIFSKFESAGDLMNACVNEMKNALSLNTKLNNSGERFNPKVSGGSDDVSAFVLQV